MFAARILRAKFRLKLGFVTLSLLLVSLPGQNDYARLLPHPQPGQVKSVSLTLPTPSDYPVHLSTPAPALTARGAIAVDVDSGTILYQKNPDLELMPASTTKIMTALVALEHYQLQDVVTVREADESIGHSMHLVKGEKITVKNLLYGILVESGNDAAFALAQNYPGGYSSFVARMNEKGQELGLINTTFRNVSGVEQWGHLTTVRDLAVLAKEAMKQPIFAQMVGTKQITVTSVDGGVTHILDNINELLGDVPGLKGIKTGWTEHAGECLVTAVERNGRTIITVVLGSNDRFGESIQLIDWAFGNHKWEEIEI